jgi:hypothetical protein
MDSESSQTVWQWRASFEGDRDWEGASNQDVELVSASHISNERFAIVRYAGLVEDQKWAGKPSLKTDR